jgi:ribosomal protein S18 acetylase RimI-like enzyme
MLIRNAEPADVPAIVELWKELMDFHSPFNELWKRSHDGPARFRALLERRLAEAEHALLLVAVEGGEIVGFTLSNIAEYPPVFVRKHFGSLSDLAVKAGHRRQGIGENLLEANLAWFRDRGMDRVEVRVAAGNEIGQAFWRKHGFADYMNTLYRDLPPTG